MNELVIDLGQLRVQTIDLLAQDYGFPKPLPLEDEDLDKVIDFIADINLCTQIRDKRLEEWLEGIYDQHDIEILKEVINREYEIEKELIRKDYAEG